MRVLVWVAVCGLLVGVPLWGQSRVETLELHAYRLEHQSAREARSLVEPLLSVRGSVELDVAGNTLILREEPSTLKTLLPLLRDFDHPARQLQLEIHILQAYRHRVSPVLPSDDLPKRLIESLGKMLRFTSYHLLAHARLSSREGEHVRYELGDNYEVDFRIGTVLLDQRLRLHGFRVMTKESDGVARAEPKRLFFSNLNLWLDQTLVLGFARDEGSDRSLVIAVTCTQVDTQSRGRER